MLNDISGKLSTNDSHSFQSDNHQINELYRLYREENNKDLFDTIQTMIFFKIQSFFMNYFLTGKITGPSDYDQLISKVFFKFLKKHHTINDPLKLTSWLNQMCFNFLMNYYKHKNRMRFIEGVKTPELFYIIEDLILNEIDRTSLVKDIINELTDTLPSAGLVILNYKLTTTLSFNEIARIMNLEIQTTKNYYSRALKAIRASKKVKTMILERTINR